MFVSVYFIWYIQYVLVCSLLCCLFCNLFLAREMKKRDHQKYSGKACINILCVYAQAHT